MEKREGVVGVGLMDDVDTQLDQLSTQINLDPFVKIRNPNIETRNKHEALSTKHQ